MEKGVSKKLCVRLPRRGLGRRVANAIYGLDLSKRVMKQARETELDQTSYLQGGRAFALPDRWSLPRKVYNTLIGARGPIRLARDTLEAFFQNPDSPSLYKKPHNLSDRTRGKHQGISYEIETGFYGSQTEQDKESWLVLTGIELPDIPNFVLSCVQRSDLLQPFFKHLGIQPVIEFKEPDVDQLYCLFKDNGWFSTPIVKVNNVEEGNAKARKIIDSYLRNKKGFDMANQLLIDEEIPPKDFYNRDEEANRTGGAVLISIGALPADLSTSSHSSAYEAVRRYYRQRLRAKCGLDFI